MIKVIRCFGAASLALCSLSFMASTASAQSAAPKAVSPTAVKYYYGVRQIHTHDGRCTAQLDAKKTAPGHWYVRASFYNMSSGCSYYLWRKKGNGAYGALSHGSLGRGGSHQTAWYWDGPGYKAMMTVNDGDGWGDVNSKPY
ncbi:MULTISPECIES: hypothetical protein [Streptomyces]|uniref:hypothetical protein n=1 Tax=Streptomyces TaxID=1883 RepID=UPI001670DAC2|nr:MULTISPECIES: hypothetical protein [Streptomyces]UFR00058.1 hypothetical protein KBP30_02140 [Streptomyces sp. Go40/10]GGS89610.1 hypothetical protein GCM10010206_60410 [Streptomyces cinerochromogenes]